MIDLIAAAYIWNADLVDEVQYALNAPHVVSGDHNTIPGYFLQRSRNYVQANVLDGDTCKIQCTDTVQ